MGVLDALTILGAGVGRGYRGSQELQRQIAEEKRKALLEEREQAVRERAAESQIQLNTAQQQAAAVEMAMTKFGLGEKERGLKRDTTPITPNGVPIKARILGNDVNLPGTLESLTSQGDLIRQLSEEQFKSQHPGYFTNYPPAGTAAAQIRNSPEARGRDYIHEILSGQLTPLMGEDEESYTLRANKMMRQKLDFLMEQDPDALNALFGKTKADSTDTTEGDDGDYSPDRPAIAPKPGKKKLKDTYTGNNRFNVKVK
jgi:hypothetical protein